MTDETAANGASGNAPNGGAALPLVVNAQYVKDLSFENPNAPASLMMQGGQPQIDLQVDVQARGVADNVSEVSLNIRAEAKIGDGIAFIAELSYAGVFTLPAGMPQDQAKALLLIEAPRLLFPFARAIIADTVRDGGYPPLMLQPLDFVDLYRRQVMGQGQQPVGQA